MQMRIDLSHIDDVDLNPLFKALRGIIPDLDKYLNKQKNLSEDLVFEVEYLHSFVEFERHIRETLPSSMNKNYDVTVDLERENTITLLKYNDLEQLGIYICDFCGAASSSEEEKYIHERAHYFF